MSTRATIHFHYLDENPSAIIYNHSDGYPSGLGEDLKNFVKEVANLPDTRFNDPNYLAAKWVVFQAEQHAKSENRLDFLGVGVCLKDPSDIEYRYHVKCWACANAHPTITVDHIRHYRGKTLEAALERENES